MCDELLSFVHNSPLKSLTKLSRLGLEVLREADMQAFGIAIFAAGVAVAAISMKLIHLKENLQQEAQSLLQIVLVLLKRKIENNESKSHIPT